MVALPTGIGGPQGHRLPISAFGENRNLVEFVVHTAEAVDHAGKHKHCLHAGGAFLDEPLLSHGLRYGSAIFVVCKAHTVSASPSKEACIESSKTDTAPSVEGGDTASSISGSSDAPSESSQPVTRSSPASAGAIHRRRLTRSLLVQPSPEQVLEWTRATVRRWRLAALDFERRRTGSACALPRRARLCEASGSAAFRLVPRVSRSAAHRLHSACQAAGMDAEQEVISAAKARAAALAAGDGERLSALLHDAFRWTSHTGDTYSRSEYIRRNTKGGTVWRSQQLMRPEVVVVGDTAVLYAEVTDVVLSDGDMAETFRMPMTQVWVRLAPGWKCLSGHAGPRRP